MRISTQSRTKIFKTSSQIFRTIAQGVRRNGIAGVAILNSPVFALTRPLRDEAILEGPFAHVIELGILRVAFYAGIEVTPACY